MAQPFFARAARIYRADYTSALKDLREACSGGLAGARRLGDPRPRYIYFPGTVLLRACRSEISDTFRKRSQRFIQGWRLLALTDTVTGFRIFLNAIGRLYCEIGAVDAAAAAR